MFLLYNTLYSNYTYNITYTITIYTLQLVMPTKWLGVNADQSENWSIVIML